MTNALMGGGISMMSTGGTLMALGHEGGILGFFGLAAVLIAWIIYSKQGEQR